MCAATELSVRCSQDLSNLQIPSVLHPDRRGEPVVTGLLIDFDYAIKVNESGRTAGPGDRTVSLADQLFSKSHST